MKLIVENYESILNLFPEVSWDRFSGDFRELTVFGWIDREDQYKDFLVLLFNNGRLEKFVTSSAKLSKEFSSRVSFNHAPCRRVEEVVKNVKMVKLNSN